MLKRIVFLFVIALCAIGVVFGGGGKKYKQAPTAGEALVTEQEESPEKLPLKDYPPNQFTPSVAPKVGTYTGLTGFMDLQSNGGTIPFIRVDPANGNVHVIFTLSEDSAMFSDSRRTGYSYSTNAGTSWNTFSNVRVPNRRSGFPSLDLGRDAIVGSPIVANHAVVGTPNKSIVSLDTPPGTGAFVELNTQANFAAGEPIWPFVAGAADGSIVVHSTINSTTLLDLNYWQRTADYSTWSTWAQFPRPNGTARSSILSTASGKVGTLVPGDGGVFLFESTDNGVTWPATPTTVLPAGGIPTGEDTLHSFSQFDLLYDGDSPRVAVSRTRRSATATSFFAGARIEFWRPATGLSTAVPWDSVSFPRGFTWVSSANHFPVGWPSIGWSGSTIVMVYTAFSADTSTIDSISNRRYGEIFFTQSLDNGLTWMTPMNITNTHRLDERYPSVSKWNPPGFAYIVWQEDTRAGSFATTTVEAPISRASQVFYRMPLPTVDVKPYDDGLVNGYMLAQNYPNPFNPATKIAYSVGTASHVHLGVYNLLGQEIATLVNDARNPGSYEVDFSAANIPSGVYFYTLKAGSYSTTKKMVVLK